MDLSTGINPWPYEFSVDTGKVTKHLPTAAEFAACAQAMSSAVGGESKQLVLAPGCELLIRLLPTILSVQRVSVVARSYSDHANAWRRAKAELIESPDPLSEIDRCDAVVICNPNNPDGRCWSREELRAARERLAARGGWLIIDEAYMDLYPEQSMLVDPLKDGLIVMRSFGKFFGLAGLRLGALFGPPTILSAMSERLGVWPVSGLALAIGVEAYRDASWQTETRRRLAVARAELDRVLQRRGLSVIGGTELYRLVRADCAENWWTGLGEQGIYTRRFDWCDEILRFGLPASDAELVRLDNALENISPSM